MVERRTTGTSRTQMRKGFKLVCQDWGNTHARFILFDPVGANCGTIILLTGDALDFVKYDWNGSVFWNGKGPLVAEPGNVVHP